MTPTLGISLLAAATFLAAIWLTARARDYAMAARLIDEANPRASHVAPTPRGGGIAIVGATMGGVAAAWIFGLISPPLAIALIAGGFPVAAIGWLDDHGHVRASGRILAHVAGAAVVVWLIGAFPLATVIPFWSPGWGWAAVAATLLFLVWLINLFNFMDGIDGIAAGEAATVAMCGLVVARIAGVANPEAVSGAAILAAAALGFLWWNWPPAQVFMGDVSSGFLGLALGALVLAAGHSAPQLAGAWVALLGVFIADATVTLGHRLIRGERVYEAHRSHAYQRLARRLGSHLPVTAGTIAVTLFFSFPIACAIAASILQPLAGVLLALVPLGVGALALGAGSAGD